MRVEYFDPSRHLSRVEANTRQVLNLRSPAAALTYLS